MENTVNIIITLGLQSDEEGGDVVGLVLPVTETAAMKTIEEQEKESFFKDNEPFLQMINAYARLCGYQRGLFVEAKLFDEARKNSKTNTIGKIKKMFNTILDFFSIKKRNYVK